jgi:uncharacterized membrane protein YfhO
MSSSVNYEKKIFEASTLGKKLAYVRRFSNIKALVNALTPEDIAEINRLRKENEDITIKENQELATLTKEFDERANKRFEETIDKEIEIYKQVENKHNDGTK